jgi:hypothetical protein
MAILVVISQTMPCIAQLVHILPMLVCLEKRITGIGQSLDEKTKNLQQTMTHILHSVHS